MAQKPIKKKKAPEERSESVSISRPRRLVKEFDKFLRLAGNELDRTLNHSEAVCALEELAMDSDMVYELLLKKLGGKIG